MIMINQMSDIKYQIYNLNLKTNYISTSFVWSKEVPRKDQPMLRLLAEFKSLVYVGKLLANARQTSHHLTSRLVKLGFNACSQRHFNKNPLFEHVYRRNSTKRSSTNAMFNELVRSFEFCLSDLNFFNARSLAATLVLPFLEKVTKKEIKQTGSLFSTKGDKSNYLNKPLFEKVTKTSVEVLM